MDSFNSFSRRHIGPQQAEIDEMLNYMGFSEINELIDKTYPDHILMDEDPVVPRAMTEQEYLQHVRELAAKNKVFTSYIGQGYYGTITPSVILRNVFENPGWYTQYTPYQAEISQGRLQALLNFQTVVSDLTGLPIANASLLDEGTAAAEAMLMFYDAFNKRRKKNPATKCFVDEHTFIQTIDVLKGRAEPLGIEIVLGSTEEFKASEDFFAVLLSYPNAQGHIKDYRGITDGCHAQGVYVGVIADLMSLCLLEAPGTWGADAVVGNTQRFGVPMGAGGPHAAYFSTTGSFKRQIPGRIIGVTIDAHGNEALRMALQTREQHIKREKATSNICTAQALLAIMAGFYAVYHGAGGLKSIAEEIHFKARALATSLAGLGYKVSHAEYFDTLHLSLDAETTNSLDLLSREYELNLYRKNDEIQISIDETSQIEDLNILVKIFAKAKGINTFPEIVLSRESGIPSSLERTTEYLTHEIFSMYHTETEMMRYIKRLESKDLSLTQSMIPLGSCTMKLNAATELMPVSFPEFSQLHPFAPKDQLQGYAEMIQGLENYLAALTGFAACSVQPNSGAQGEYAGLMTIRAYHKHHKQEHRNIALIPESAHGTNPASAVMSGMKVVVVKCDENGNINVEDLGAKAIEHKDNLAALMVTYPSTHGVFETAINEITAIVHENGGLVYMDGANMNAQLGYSGPASIGADVCHLNLHKTFAIPHGGGGPGVGPICVNEKLKPFLPTHPVHATSGELGIKPVSSAPWGSASILLISYGFIRMLGLEGLKKVSRVAILNANYIMERLGKEYEILYKGDMGRCGHEVIVDFRPFKAIGVEVVDVAKRLMDYGFHAPTMSFPVAGTLMIEPTESENKAELDRFCDAMLAIKKEIDEVARGEADPENNVLKNAPHAIQYAVADEWQYPYSREKAVYPLPYLRKGYKFWVDVGRVNDAYGDRNLVCTCPPMSAYVDGE